MGNSIFIQHISLEFPFFDINSFNVKLTFLTLSQILAL